MKLYTQDGSVITDTSTIYTKSETDAKLNTKANSSDTYTKSQVYTKTETDTKLNGKANASNSNGIGICSTAESTTAKVVSITNYSQTTGCLAVVKFTYAIPASSTLNINSLGAKPIYFMGSAITSGIIIANDVVTFLYDGSKYNLLSIDRWGKLISQISIVTA